MNSFDGSKRQAFVQSNMFARNIVGGAQFTSAFFQGYPLPVNIVQRPQHFIPFFPTNHWHSQHLPEDFIAANSYSAGPGGGGFLELPPNAIGWYRVLVRVKGVCALVERRQHYDGSYFMGWEDPVAPFFFLGGFGIYGDIPSPTYSNVYDNLNEGTAPFGPFDIYIPRSFPDSFIGTNILVNEGEGDAVGTVVEIDRFVELSINASAGRRINLGALGGWIHFGGSSGTFFYGGTMPDGVTQGANFPVSVTGFRMGTDGGVTLQPGAIYPRNPGINPINLSTGQPIFNQANPPDHNYHLIGQIYGYRAAPTSSVPVIYDA